MTTKYGAHGESSNQIIPLQRAYQAHGVSLAVTLGMENPGLATDAKALGVPLTISRWTNPNGRWEGGQDVLSWSLFERNDFVGHSIQMIFDRTNDTEYKNSDYFVPGYNEWCPNDPFQDDWTNPDGTRKSGRKPYPAGWKAMGEVFCMMLDKATERSQETTRLGLHPIRLALPGFNAGTPEYTEMVAFFGAKLVDGVPLAQKMKQRGDILLCHEGVFFNQPIDTGFGQQLPGAPIVPNSGTLCLRVNVCEYVIQQIIGSGIPWVAGEWYDGNTKDTDPKVRLAAMRWYDQHARLSPWYRGFCAFELTDDPNSTWAKVDFTKTFNSEAMLLDMIAQKDMTDAMTNQDMFNAVAAVGKKEGKNLIAQMPFDLVGQMGANRTAEYTGPSPLSWGLTLAEKQAIVALLPTH